MLCNKVLALCAWPRRRAALWRPQKPCGCFYKRKSRFSEILLYQAFGFLAIIGLSWMDELAGLRHLVFGNNWFISDYRESALEMLLVLGVWLLVAGSTRRLLARMRHLESFMRVCAWCRRIDYHGTWMDLEDFLKMGFDTPTTHGICEECLAKEKAALERARSSPPLAP